MSIATLTSNESGANSLIDINANFVDLDTTKADLASPVFTGTPTLPTGTIATTQSSGDNSTKVATTAFVSSALTSGSTSGVSVGPASSSTQTITHGLGRTPTIIRLDGVGQQQSGTGSPHSHGVYDTSGNRCVYMPGTGENTTPLSSTTFAISLYDSDATATGIVGNLTSTTFDIVWTTSANANLTVFLWEAQ